MNEQMEEVLVKKLVERFKISESAAHKKLCNSSVQMVIEILLDESGINCGDLVSALNADKEFLDAEKAKLSKLESKIKEMDKRLEAKAESLNDLHKQLTAATTEEAKDRIRLLDAYNNLILESSEDKRLTYDAYIKGAVSILSGIPMR